MDDASFSALTVEASIAPQSANWPKPDYSKVSIEGDKPHVSAGELHWDALHACKDAARKHTLKFLGACAGIDENKSLSVDGKREAKAQAAEAALTALEKSQALEKARAAVEQQVAKWNTELAPPTLDPAIAAEIRNHVALLRDGERLAFAMKHIAECAPAVLGAPAFLSKVSAEEAATIRKQFETTINPEIAPKKRQALDALEHVSAGFRNAVRTIREGGGLKEASNGGAAA